METTTTNDYRRGPSASRFPQISRRSSWGKFGFACVIAVAAWLGTPGDHAGGAGKPDIVEKVVERVDALPPEEAAAVFDAGFEAIRENLKRGDAVHIDGFGSFSVRRRSERKGQHPVTGETIVAPAGNNVRFKPAKELTGAVYKTLAEQ